MANHNQRKRIEDEDDSASVVLDTSTEALDSGAARRPPPALPTDAAGLAKAVEAGIIRAAELGVISSISARELEELQKKMPQFATKDELTKVRSDVGESQLTYSADLGHFRTQLQALREDMKLGQSETVKMFGDINTKLTEINVASEAKFKGVTDTLVKVARDAGFHEEANALDSKGVPKGFGEKFGMVMNSQVRVKHLGYMVLGAGVVVLLWEGLAYMFDWRSLFWGPRIAEAPAPTVVVKKA